MSIFSGKCDLADHLSFEKMYKVTGEELKELRKKTPEELYEWSKIYKEPENWTIGVSDDLECFEEFKKKTGGVIYQHIKVEVTEYNQHTIARNSDNNLKLIVHTEQVDDKRLASGKRLSTTYTYLYWGVEYTSLKALNKHGVYVRKEIHFNTLLDLLPYYPYIVSAYSHDGKNAIVYISNNSFVDDEENDNIRISGSNDTMAEYYRKTLSKHYRDVVLQYFNPEGRHRTETLKVFKGKDAGLYVKTSEPIDYNFDIEVRLDAHGNIWSKPICDSQEAYDLGIVNITNVWLDSCHTSGLFTNDRPKPGDTITLTYVAKGKGKLFLGF